MPILIRKVAEPFGWLGNMSPHPVVYNGQSYRTTEALFQSLRFDDVEIINLIRQQKSPMAAKMLAKKRRAKRVVEPCSPQDLDNMRLCLHLKIEQHSSLRDQLVATRPEEIVEDCTKRPRGLFWGAAFKDGQWIGENHLGKMRMELRASM